MFGKTGTFFVRLWRFFTIKREQPEFIVGKNAYRADRFLSALIDGGIQIILTIPLGIYLFSQSISEVNMTLTGYIMLYQIILFFIFHGYLLYFFGQTIGKHTTGIRIENLDGTKASFLKIVFARMLPMSAFSVIPVIGTLISGPINPLLIFGNNRRCLHDYIARTKVCNTDS